MMRSPLCWDAALSSSLRRSFYKYKIFIVRIEVGIQDRVCLSHAGIMTEDKEKGDAA